MTLRSLLFLAMLAAATSPAGAATRFVSQSARGSGSGADSTNAQAIVDFNWNAVPGDVALLMGNFTTNAIPRLSGTAAAPIVYRSLSGKPNDVCFPGGIWANGTQADSNVVWRDLTVRNGFDLGAGTETARWQVRNVRIIDGGMSMTFVRDAHIDSVYSTNTKLTQSGVTLLAGGTNPCQRDTLRNSSFAVLAADGTGSTAVNIFTGIDNFYEAVRCTVTTTANAANTALRFGRVCATVRGMMKDCYFVGTNNTPGGGADEPMCFSFKDGVANFKMYRDTIITRGTVNGAAPWISFGQSESWGAIGGNTLRNCYIRNEAATDWGIVWNVGFDGDSLVGNTFLALGPIQSAYNGGSTVSPSPTIVDHNLFATFGKTSALDMQNVVADHAVTFTNNIFYEPSLTNADSNATHAVNFGNAGNWGSSSVGPVGNNYNLAWVPGMSTRRLVSWSGGVSAFGMNPWLGTRSPATLDANSIGGPLRMVDSTLAHFDAHPLAGSAALYGPDGYVGPFVLAGTGDTTPPGQVNDLRIASALQSSVTLAWTSPGNDGYAGTAAAYDIRWSAAPINAGNFGAANAVSGAPSPAVAGTAQTVSVPNLLASTLYYFALMTRDGAGNWSPLSTVQGTTAPDTTPPAAITNLRPGP